MSKKSFLFVVIIAEIIKTDSVYYKLCHISKHHREQFGLVTEGGGVQRSSQTFLVNLCFFIFKSTWKWMKPWKTFFFCLSLSNFLRTPGVGALSKIRWRACAAIMGPIVVIKRSHWMPLCFLKYNLVHKIMSKNGLLPVFSRQMPLFEWEG